jgi:hypothetical protein
MLFVPDDSIFFFVPQETKRMEHKIKERKAASPPALPRREGAGAPKEVYLESVEHVSPNFLVLNIFADRLPPYGGGRGERPAAFYICISCSFL